MLNYTPENGFDKFCDRLNYLACCSKVVRLTGGEWYFMELAPIILRLGAFISNFFIAFDFLADGSKNSCSISSYVKFGVILSS